MDAYQDAMLRALERAGQIIFKDDEKDFGKFSYPEHPSPIHHWQWGLLMTSFAKAARALDEFMEVMDVFSDDIDFDVLEAGLQEVIEAVER